MRIAGLPVWALVLGACVLVPFVVQVWIDAERRRAKERTRLLLQTLDAARASRIASGPRNAASQSRDMHRDDDSS
jgi:hypothetical protein